jgi:hypothetical protein
MRLGAAAWSRVPEWPQREAGACDKVGEASRCRRGRAGSRWWSR